MRDLSKSKTCAVMTVSLVTASDLTGTSPVEPSRDNLNRNGVNFMVELNAIIDVLTGGFLNY